MGRVGTPLIHWTGYLIANGALSLSLNEHTCFCFVVIENEIGGHLAEHTECAKVIELAASRCHRARRDAFVRAALT